MRTSRFYNIFLTSVFFLALFSTSSCTTLGEKITETDGEGVHLFVRNNSFDRIGVYYSQGPHSTTWTPAVDGVGAISNSDTVRIEAKPQRGQLHLCIYRLGNNRQEVKRMCDRSAVGNANLVKYINIFPGALVELDVNNKLSATVGVWQMPSEKD